MSSLIDQAQVKNSSPFCGRQRHGLRDENENEHGHVMKSVFEYKFLSPDGGGEGVKA